MERHFVLDLGPTARSLLSLTSDQDLDLDFCVDGWLDLPFNTSTSQPELIPS